MNKKKYTLLYAEDNQMVRDNYKIYLQQYFDTIYEAGDGEEALKIYESKQPDVIILDIQMPKINGLEVAKKIRLKNDKVKIILLTAYSDTSRLLKAVQLNLINYLIKPVNRFELNNAIEKTFVSIEKENSIKNTLVDIGSNIKLDKNNVFLYKNNDLIELSKYEQELLKLFINRTNKIVSKIDIFNQVWDDFSKEYNDSSVRNLVKNLRKKLPKDIITSIYGSGYIFKI